MCVCRNPNIVLMKRKFAQNSRNKFLTSDDGGACEMGSIKGQVNLIPWISSRQDEGSCRSVLPFNSFIIVRKRSFKGLVFGIFA